MLQLTKRQLAALLLLTLFWGINWPVMKSAVTGDPPFTFRALSMLLGLPCLAFGDGGDAGAVCDPAPALA